MNSSVETGAERARFEPWVFLCGFVFVLSFAWSCLRTYELAQAGGDASRVGDWLINYSGGFVRRGLIGAGLLPLGRAFPGSLLWITLSLQLALYAVLLTTAFLLLRPHLSRRPTFIFLALSPGTFLFEALNHDSFRKELLALSFLGIFCLMVRKSQRHLTAGLFAITVLSPCLVLSHEGLIPLLPYFCIALFLVQPHFNWRRPLVLLPAVFSGLAFLAALFVRADEQTAEMILSSLEGWVPQGSLVRKGGGGAIRALAHDMSKGLQLVEARLGPPHHYFVKYSLGLLLTAFPFFLLRSHWRAAWREPRIQWLFGAALLMTAVMAVVAIDWGRFIYMNAAALALVLCLLPPEDKSTLHASTRIPGWLFAFALVAYTSLWRLPISAAKLRTGFAAQGVVWLLSSHDVRSE